MRNILFTAPTDEKILSGQDMTVLGNTPPSEPDRHSVHRQKKCAEIRIRWLYLVSTSKKRTGYSLGEIAEKEGFARWEDFVNAYVSLNQREHYFMSLNW